MKHNNYFGNISIKLILFLLCFIVLVPVSPALQPIPHRDSGVFLYIGKGVLEGKIPYLDFWDHKGPLIYYINALGLFLFKESYWGVWFIEILFLTISAMLGFSLMRNRFAASIAIVGSASWVLALGNVFTTQFGGGNHVEEYALLLYMAQIYLFLRRRKNMPGTGEFFFIGVFAGLCILLRPNLISPLAGIYLTILWEMFMLKKEDRTKHFQALAVLSSGLVLTLAIVLFYFWGQNAIRDMLNDVIVYNFYYSGSDTKYLSAFFDSFRVLGLINVVGLATWAALILFYKKNILPAKDHFLVRFLILLTPIEVVLSLLSGQGYIHYFISWLPVLGILLCVFMEAGQSFLRKLNNNFYNRYGWVVLCIIVLFQAVPLIKDLQIYYSVMVDKLETGNLFLTGSRRSPEWDDMRRLYDVVPVNSEVLFWGNEVEYNFVMKFPSPARYIYLYPFMDGKYATNPMRNEFLSAIKEMKPVIVDVQPSSVPPIKSLSKWKEYPGMLPVIYYIKNNYHAAQEMNVTSYYYVDNQVWSVTHKWIIWVHN
ncbi:MAG: glycosyltransferase family 39 protein [Chloroflexi bacterium]|nr:glycosyltransferase family 39 protein [Chloroflexota bacterium]